MPPEPPRAFIVSPRGHLATTFRRKAIFHPPGSIFDPPGADLAGKTSYIFHETSYTCKDYDAESAAFREAVSLASSMLLRLFLRMLFEPSVVEVLRAQLRIWCLEDCRTQLFRCFTIQVPRNFILEAARAQFF